MIPGLYLLIGVKEIIGLDLLSGETWGSGSSIHVGFKQICNQDAVDGHPLQIAVGDF